MFLYELAIELGKRSTDLADEAAAAGLGALGPTDSLTADQVAVLRGQGVPAGGAPGPDWGGGPTTGHTAVSPTPSGSSDGVPKPVLVVLAVLVLVGGVFFSRMVLGSIRDPDVEAERREQESAANRAQAEKDAKAADVAILERARSFATMADGTEVRLATADDPADRATDLRRYCTAVWTAVTFERTAADRVGKATPALWPSARQLMLDGRAAWHVAMATIIETSPPNARADWQLHLGGMGSQYDLLAPDTSIETWDTHTRGLDQQALQDAATRANAITRQNCLPT